MTQIYYTGVDTPWIYHHEWLGLISLSSDGQNWITIADKNLGATEVWNYWDMVNENNGWNYYQWWNNYGFNLSWPTLLSDISVDASTYGPWNYYNNNVFINSPQPPAGEDDYWDSSHNENLWWYETWTLEAMQWPCPNWFHIPSKLEWQTNIQDVLQSFHIMTASSFEHYLFFPSNGVIGRDGIINWVWSSINIWLNTRSTIPYYFLCIPNQAMIISKRSPKNGFSIRPFKNTPVQPDTFRTVLYQPN